MNALKNISIIGYGSTLLLFAILLIAPISEFLSINILAWIMMAIFFATGLFSGAKNGYLKWLYPIFSAIVLMVVVFTSYELVVTPPASYIILFVQSPIPAVFGLAAGVAIRKIHYKCKGRAN